MKNFSSSVCLFCFVQGTDWKILILFVRSIYLLHLRRLRSELLNPGKKLVTIKHFLTLFEDQNV